MVETPTPVALYGTPHAPAPSRALRAGPLVAELEEGGLRAVRWHGVEILRGVSYLVRDTGWGTLPARISAVEVAEGPEGFGASYEAVVEAPGLRYTYCARIRGLASGRLDFEVEGTALTDVRTCRTGFVVLHPLEGVVDRPVEVLHADGTRESARFPRLISPGQPIFAIRALSHEPAPGIRATCTLEGDVFEMEDQRNWTDASFKTYVRPLALPFPYTIPAGERVSQAVRLEVAGVPASVPVTGAGSRVTVGAPPMAPSVTPSGATMPQVGLGLDPRRMDEALAVADLVREAGVTLLVGRFEPGLLGRYRDVVAETGAELMLELPLPCRRGPDEELGDIAEAIARAGLKVTAVSPVPAAYLKSYQPSGPWPDVPPFAEVFRAARRAFPGVAIGGGVHAYFTELNRARPPVEGCDHVGFTTSPLVHAADERSLWESLEALPHVVETARSFCGDAPLRVGPSAIGMRDNPYGTAPVENPGNARVAMARMDPRQRGLFGAAWVLGYVAALARAGVRSIALGAPAGEFGFAYRRTDYAQPWFDETPGARAYPAYHVLRALAGAAGRPLLDVVVEGGGIASLGWEGAAGPELWLANGGPEPVRVSVHGMGAGVVRLLDAESFAGACRDPRWADAPGDVRALADLTLPSCGVARFAAA